MLVKSIIHLSFYKQNNAWWVYACYQDTRKIVLILSAIFNSSRVFFRFKFIGSEFLPELNEGAIWLRVQLPYSASLQKGVEVAIQNKKHSVCRFHR